MVLHRIQWWLEKEKWWSPYQYGGVIGKTVEGAIADLISHIQIALASKGVCAVLFLDVAKAFDTINFNAIIKALGEARISKRMKNWLESFIKGRKAKILCNGDESEYFQIERGIPQGAVLSPMLYGMATNDFNIDRSEDKFSVQFVDDGAVGTSDKTIKGAINKLKGLIPRVEGWAREKDIKFNPDKSVVVVFTRKKWNCEDINVRLGGVRVPCGKKTRYLGMRLDSELRWGNHINYLKAEVRKRHHLMRAISGMEWGVTTINLRTIYITMVQALVDFGAGFYREAGITKIGMLDKELLRCIRTILGVPVSTQKQSMFVETNIMPFDLKREYVQIRTFVNLAAETQTARSFYMVNRRHGNKDKWPGGRPIAFTNKDIQINLEWRNIGISPKVISRIPPWLIKACDIKIIEGLEKGDPYGNNNGIWNDWKERNNITYAVYTDGSVEKEGRVTCGFWCPDRNDNREVELPEGSNIFDAELYGIYLAVKWIDENTGAGGDNIVIASDSLSAVKYLNNNHKWVFKTLVEYIWEIIYKLQMKGNVITLVWVPSHSGIQGNNCVDNNITKIRPLNRCGGPFHQIQLRNIVKFKLRKIWERRWRIQRTSLSKYCPDLNDRVKIRWPERQWDTTLTFARVGRFKTKALRAKWDDTVDPNCELCHVEQTVEHILLDCLSAKNWCERLPKNCEHLQRDELLPILLGVGPKAKMCTRKIVKDVVKTLINS